MDKQAEQVTKTVCYDDSLFCLQVLQRPWGVVLVGKVEILRMHFALTRSRRMEGRQGHAARIDRRWSHSPVLPDRDQV